MQILVFFLKVVRSSKRKILFSINNISVRILLRANAVKYGKSLNTKGMPFIDIALKGRMSIGDSFRMNNGRSANIIGRQQPCSFVVMKGASLEIKNNVGISATAIVCSTSIIIGNNVRIGGNTVIYDTDFHSLIPMLRLDSIADRQNAKTAPVIINDNVFIGAHSTILKGVVIGENSIVGAGSLVTKCIPANEIWAGNPAKFIKKVEL